MPNEIEWQGGAGGPLSSAAKAAVEQRRSGEEVEISDEMIDRACIAGREWFALHPDGASSSDEWRDHYRIVLEASLKSR